MTARRTLALVTATLLAFPAVSCSGDEGRRPERGSEAKTIEVVVDTDMGTDDVMALLFLLEHPDVSVVAVTIAGDGLTHPEAGVRNARSLLALAGSPETPVAAGRASPLAGENAFPEEWRTYSDDLSAVPDLPAPAGAPYEGTAVDLLLGSVDADTTLLTLGPLTNVAEALRADPGLADRVGRVVSMAGAVDAPGNAPNGVAEYNVWIDAQAAKEVADAMPVELVPLDASNFVQATPFFVEALGRNLGTPAARAIHALLATNGQIDEGTYYFWDPLAAVLLVDPRVATWDRDRFLINASLDAGAGWMSRWDEGIPAMFAVRADVEEFERIFLSTVAGRLVIHSRPRPDLIVRFDGRRCVVNSVVLPAGDVVVRFGNDSSDGASVVILGLPGTTYEQLVRAIGPPGSAVARRPEGVRQIGWLRAGPHVRTLGRVAAPPGDAGIFCLIESTDGTANVWPGGPIRFEG